MDIEERLVWTVHPDGLHIHVGGRLVGVIDPDEGIHLIASFADCIRHYMAAKKNPALGGVNSG